MPPKINCSKCGQFVGKNGFLDIIWDNYNGGYEMGYPLCEKCLAKVKSCSPLPSPSPTSHQSQEP